MGWLRSTGKALDISAEVETLAELAVFLDLTEAAEVLGELPQNIAAFTQKLEQNQIIEASDALRQELRKAQNALDLVAILALEDQLWGKLDAVVQEAEALGLDGGGVRAAITSARDFLGQVPDKYYKLLRHVDAFQESSSGEDPGLVDWTLSKRGDSSPALAEGMALELSAGGEASLELEAGHLYPFPESDSRYLRLGIAGQMDASASASVPFNAGSLTAAAGAEASLHANYMFGRATSSGTYAAEAAAALQSLANPTSLNDLYPAMTTGPLKAMTVTMAGAAFMEAAVGISRSLDIGRRVSIDQGLTVSAEIRTAGAYQLVARSLADNKVELQLNASQSRTQGLGMVLGVTINASELAKHVKSELGEALAPLKQQYSKLDKWLQPGELLRGKINELIGQHVNDATATTLLKLATGQVTQEQAEAKLTELVEGYVDSQTAAWSDDITEGVNAGLAWLTSRYPALNHPELAGRLKTVLEGTLSNARASIKTEVSGISDTMRKRLLKMLDKAGVRFSALTTEVDSAAAGLQQAIRNYVETVEKVLNRAEELAMADLRIQVSADTSSTLGSAVSARAVVSRNNADTRKAYGTLISGKLDAILKLADSPVTGFDLSLNEWQRFATMKSQGGLSLVLLDIKLSDTTVFSSETRMLVEEGGVLSIMSRADYLATRSLGAEQKMFQFGSVFSLLRARAGASYVSSISLAYSDEAVGPGDVKRFLTSLVEAELVHPDAIDSARRILTRARGHSDDSVMAKSVGVEASLERDALERWISASKGACATATLDALIASGYFSAEEFRRGYHQVRTSLGQSPGIEAGALLLKLTRQKQQWAKNDAVSADDITRDGVEKWANAHDKSRWLFKMLEGMQDVYKSKPKASLSSAKLVLWYQDRQKPINQALKQWIRQGSWLSDFVRPETSPHTIAFLLVIEYLANAVDPYLLHAYLALGENQRIELPAPA